MYTPIYHFPLIILVSCSVSPMIDRSVIQLIMGNIVLLQGVWHNDRGHAIYIACCYKWRIHGDGPWPRAIRLCLPSVQFQKMLFLLHSFNLFNVHFVNVARTALLIEYNVMLMFHALGGHSHQASSGVSVANLSNETSLLWNFHLVLTAFYCYFRKSYPFHGYELWGSNWNLRKVPKKRIRFHSRDLDGSTTSI